MASRPPDACGCGPGLGLRIWREHVVLRLVCLCRAICARRRLASIATVAPGHLPCVGVGRFPERVRSSAGAALLWLRQRRSGSGPWSTGSDSLAPEMQALLGDRLLMRPDARRGRREAGIFCLCPAVRPGGRSAPRAWQLCVLMALLRASRRGVDPCRRAAVTEAQFCSRGGPRLVRGRRGRLASRSSSLRRTPRLGGSPSSCGPGAASQLRPKSFFGRTAALGRSPSAPTSPAADVRPWRSTSSDELPSEGRSRNNSLAQAAACRRRNLSVPLGGFQIECPHDERLLSRQRCMCFWLGSGWTVVGSHDDKTKQRCFWEGVSMRCSSHSLRGRGGRHILATWQPLR